MNTRVIALMLTPEMAHIAEDGALLRSRRRPIIAPSDAAEAEPVAGAVSLVLVHGGGGRPLDVRVEFGEAGLAEEEVWVRGVGYTLDEVLGWDEREREGGAECGDVGGRRFVGFMGFVGFAGVLGTGDFTRREVKVLRRADGDILRENVGLGLGRHGRGWRDGVLLLGEGVLLYLHLRFHLRQSLQVCRSRRLLGADVAPWKALVNGLYHFLGSLCQFVIGVDVCFRGKRALVSTEAAPALFAAVTSGAAHGALDKCVERDTSIGDLIEEMATTG